MAESLRPSRFLQRVPHPDARMPTGAEMAADLQRNFEKAKESELKISRKQRNRSSLAFEQSDIVFIPRRPKRVLR